MSKAIFFTDVGKAEYSDILNHTIYMPSSEEQEKCGVVMILDHSFRSPKEGEIQIEVLASGICTHEVSIFSGELSVPAFPMIPGHESVGRVIAAGKDVKKLKEGDLVSCCWYMGQWSKIITGPAELAYKINTDETDEAFDPAMWIIEPAASIVNAVSHMEILPGYKALVIGAGYMGLMMINLLSHFPLSKLSVFEVKEFNRKAAFLCGADEVFDPKSMPVEEMHEDLVNNQYDLVVECSGSQSALDDAIKFCKVGGQVAIFAWHRSERSIDFKTTHLKGTRIINTSPAIDIGREYSRYWPITISLFERGIFNHRYLITHRYNAEDIVDAMIESKKRGEGFIKSVLVF